MKSRIYKDILDDISSFKTIDEVREYLNKKLEIDVFSCNYTVDNVPYASYDFSWINSIPHSHIYDIISCHPNVLMQYLLSEFKTKKYGDLIYEKLNYKISDALYSIYIADNKSKIFRIEYSEYNKLLITFMINKQQKYFDLPILKIQVNDIIREKKLQFIENI